MCEVVFIEYVGFQAITATSMKMDVLCDVTLYSLVEVF